MRKAGTFSILTRCFLAMGMVVAMATFAPCQQSDDLLAVLKVGHQATRESIRTFSAIMVVEQRSPGKERQKTLECNYWRTPAAVRCRESYEGGRLEDYLQTPSERKQVGTYPKSDGKGVQVGAGRASPVKGRVTADIWANMLIDFPNGTGGMCDLNRFLEVATKPPTVKKERLDGHDCLYLTAQYNDIHLGEVRLEAWFDPKVGYLVRKRVMSWAKIRSESRIQSFQQVGEWSFPEKCEGGMVVAGKAGGTVVYATVSAIKINAPLPANIFQLAVPDGTMLFDSFDNTRYQVNSRWERTGRKVAVPIAGAKLPDPQPDGDAPYFTEQSREEAPSPMRWLLWGSLALLGLGGCVWVWRNRGRLKRQAS